MTSERLEVVVIGGGLAGAAAAWGLARRGHRVTVVEREGRAGVHASGRNAGMIRQVVEDPAIGALAREGARLLTAPPEDLRAAAGLPPGGSLLRPTGSILLAGPEQGHTLEEAARTAQAGGLACELLAPEALAGALLGLEPLERARGGVAVRTPSDGVADPHAVLSALLGAARTHGATLRLGTLARIASEHGRVRGVALARADAPGETELLAADVVVNAAGPWAAELVAAAGGLELALVARRRHLFYTGPLAGIDPQHPWVWDVERGFYVRPESAGLLLCACDTDPRPPEDAAADPGARDRLARKVARLAPELVDHPIARAWAGLRTFSPDEGFVVGFDPHLGGLYWLAALGGHGLTTSCALGLLAADGVEGVPGLLHQALAPARFQALGLCKDAGA